MSSYGSPPSSSDGTSALVVSLGVVVVVLLAVVGVGAWLFLGRDDAQPAATTSSAGSAVPVPPESESATADEEPVEDEEPVDDEDPATEDTSTDDSPSEDAVADEPTPPASDAASEPLTAEEPVAVVEGELPGLVMEVLPLRRDGDQVTLEVALVVSEDAENFSADGCRFTTDNGCAGSGGLENPDDFGDFTGATLIDVVNAQRHLVLREAESGECLCSRNMAGLDPGDRLVVSASFPAPPDDVTAMTVEVPKFPAVPEVPVS